ncbi:MAG: S8 family serine peptidase [Gemmatimonadaceae bacterium]
MNRRPLVLIASTIFAVGACSDPVTSPSVIAKAPTGWASVRSAATPTVPTDQHVFLMNGNSIPDNFAADVAAAGGTLVRVQSEIGMAVVKGLTDGAAARLARSNGKVERDLLVQWLPPVDASQFVVAPDEASLVAGQSVLPPQAAFFGAFQWDMRQIHAPEAWAGHTGIPSVRVAILDTGLDPDHIDAQGLIDVASSIAFTPSVTGPPAWADDHFHGTHVGGTVTSNNFGTAGVAPNVTLIAVKVLNASGSGTFADIISGLIWAANVHANVANLSLGALFPKNGSGTLIGALNKAVNYANAHGVLVVSAAGNEAADLQHDQNYTSVPCESGTGICIASTGPGDLHSSFSNYGISAINLAAPGGEFGPAPTHFVLSLCSSRSAMPGLVACKSKTRYLFVIGTSQATPHVSGLAALLDSQYGGMLNPARLQTIMQQCADNIGGDPTDPFFGKGRINAFKTVTGTDCTNSSK